MRYHLSEESRVEEFGDELLICSPANSAVHRMVGPAADAVRTALAAGHAGVELSDDETTLALVGAGILVQTPPQGHEMAPAGSRISRRRMIGVGAVAAGAVGLVTLTLPGAAAAASGGEPDPDLPREPDESITSSYSGTGGNAGRLQVFWESGPDAFEYTYSITIISGTPSGQPLSGTLASGSSFNVIYNLEPNSSISVTFTSLTNPAASTTQAFSRA
jgi:hypothetical protein